MIASKDAKILFTGTPGAGKTTAIGAISDKPPIVTDVDNTDPLLGKQRTTVGFDYGEVDLGGGERVRLFGTPGQARFDFLWHILAKDALGIVILMDNSRPHPLQDLALYLQTLRSVLSVTACTVGVGRLEAHPVPSLDDYTALLASQGLVFPVLSVDVRNRDDVLMLMDTVLAQAEAANEEIDE